MGQYYIICNISKAQFLDPHKFGDGLKLLEFGYSSHGTLLGLAILLADGNGRGGGDLATAKPIVGSWAGDRIVVAGDYADKDQFLPDKWFDLPIMQPNRLEEKDRKRGAKVAGDVFKAGDPPNLYHLARVAFADVSELVISAIRDDGYSKFSPNTQNFIDSTMWVKEPIRFGRAEAKTEKLDLLFLVPDQMNRVLFFAAQKGQPFFDPYVKWLLAQNLPLETTEALSRVEWNPDAESFDKYRFRQK